MTSHWGEIIENETAGPAEAIDVSSDIERAITSDLFPNYNYDGDLMLRNLDINLPPMDPLVMHTIALHKYDNDMAEKINLADVAMDVMIMTPNDEDLLIPPMPEIQFKHKPNCLNFIPRDFTDFSKGIDVEMPELSKNVVREILNKCIATLFAHIGYETSYQSVLDVLVDVVDMFYKNLCTKLRETVEDEENHQCTGFPNAIEKVLVDMGMGGAKSLHEYYQNRVIKYMHIMEMRCLESVDHYRKLLAVESPPPNLFQEISEVKKEQDCDEIIDVTDVHTSESPPPDRKSVV